MKMVEIENLNFEYPDKKVLHDVSFSIEAGSVTALVGPNGAGKTTLLRCMVALEKIHSGKITIGGFDVTDHPREIHHMTGYLSDFFGLYEGMTLRQCLTYMGWCQKIPELDLRKRIYDVAEEVGISKILDQKAQSLSRGYRQRLGVGLALIHDPRFLILDEPSSGLDPDARIALSRLIRRLHSQGKTIIVSSHILNELEDYCTDMLVIKDGRVAQQVHLDDYARSARRVIEIGISGLGTAHIEFITAQPLVKVTGVSGEVVSLEFRGDTGGQQQLLQTLVQANIPVYSFSATVHTLQDAYMDLTSGKGQ